MKNNFLVLLCGHVDSEEKKNLVLETLDGFEKEGIDVCYSTHTPNYLDEISKKVKFTVFDSNNQFVTKHDYIENIDLLENLETYGLSIDYKYQSFGKIESFFPSSPHTRSAMSLLKNGTVLSYLNSYEWSIYLEYDVPTPINGFKNFIENKISMLEEKNSECFYYTRGNSNFNFLWGNFFMFKTVGLYNNYKFTNGNWYISPRAWIDNWRSGFFESICQYILCSTFDSSKIITKDINEEFHNFWNAESYDHISKYYHQQSFYINEKSLEFGLSLQLYPSKRNDVYDLHLYIDYSGSEGLLISNIIVRNQQQILFKIDELYPEIGHWYLFPVVYNDSKKIVLEYTLSNKTYTKNYSLNYNLEYIEIMYNNLCRIDFN